MTVWAIQSVWVHLETKSTEFYSPARKSVQKAPESPPKGAVQVLSELIYPERRSARDRNRLVCSGLCQSNDLDTSHKK
jgi:hypothetical protein